MEIIKCYIRASRLPSQSYIFFPLLLGQAMAFSVNNYISITIFSALVVVGFTIQLYIVYANDYADLEVDADNHTYTIFTGGSRVLIDGTICKATMVRAIWLMLVFNLLLGICFTICFQRPLSLIFIISALFLLFAYSYHPIKLSYRGGGELLQVLGVAVLLPLFSFYLQTGGIDGFHLLVIYILIPNTL